MAVRTTTLDDFASQHGLDHIYHLAIDAEGSDPLILEGMTNLLSRRKVALLQFEYNRERRPFHSNYWAARGVGAEARSLASVVRRLASFGYTCFLEAPRHLVPLSPPCWRKEFDGWRKWSNVLCAHEAEVLERLTSRFVAG